MNFLAQPPLRADAKAVPHDQHPDHQLRINRRPTYLAIKRRQLAPHLVEFNADRVGDEPNSFTEHAGACLGHRRQVGVVDRPAETDRQLGLR